MRTGPILLPRIGPAPEAGEGARPTREQETPRPAFLSGPGEPLWAVVKSKDPRVAGTARPLWDLGPLLVMERAVHACPQPAPGPLSCELGCDPLCPLVGDRVAAFSLMWQGWGQSIHICLPHGILSSLGRDPCGNLSAFRSAGAQERNASPARSEGGAWGSGKVAWSGLEMMGRHGQAEERRARAKAQRWPKQKDGLLPTGMEGRNDQGLILQTPVEAWEQAWPSALLPSVGPPLLWALPRSPTPLSARRTLSSQDLGGCQACCWLSVQQPRRADLGPAAKSSDGSPGATEVRPQNCSWLVAEGQLPTHLPEAQGGEGARGV